MQGTGSWATRQCSLWGARYGQPCMGRSRKRKNNQKGRTCHNIKLRKRCNLLPTAIGGATYSPCKLLPSPLQVTPLPTASYSPPHCKLLPSPLQVTPQLTYSPLQMAVQLIPPASYSPPHCKVLPN